VRTLQRRLKAGLATTPQDLVLAARLEAARCLLAEGRWRVGEVAAQVGFDDPSHFTRRFRAAYGQAPSQLSSPQSRPD
jgi:AraC-like DNA-binding protein